MIKVSLLWTLFFVYFNSFSQTTLSNPNLYKSAEILAKESPAEKNFKLTINYAKQQNWDSVLVASAKTISTCKNKEILDFSHYFRGTAFRKKEIYKQALKEFDRVPRSFKFYPMLQLMRGEIYLEQSKFEQSLACFTQVDTSRISQVAFEAAQHNIGLCYFHLGDYQKAESFLMKAISNREQRKDEDQLIATYMDLANVYYEQYLDEQAIAYFEKAYLLSKKHGTYYLKQNAALNMAVVEENRGRFQEAVAYQKEYQAWHDSLNDQNKIYEVAELEKKQAVEQKQRQVKLLETENKLKQTELNMYLFAALSLFIILVFGTYLYRQNVKRSRIILKQKQELDLLNATKDQLFSIVSHDLRSSVHALRVSNSTLKNQVTQKEYESLEDQLEQNSSIATNTYNMLDNLLHWALLQTEGGYFKQEEHRLSMLVDQVAFNFQGILKQKNISFENQLPKAAKVFVDAESLKIVLRNFMDNSIKFSDENGEISVVLLEDSPNFIRFQWQDRGKGMSEETRLKLLSDSPQLTKKDHEKTIGSGLGMNLCRAMLNKNGGQLDIWSERSVGTKMIVTLQKVSAHGKD